MAEAVLTYVVRLDDADEPVAFQAARAASSELETVVTSYAERLEAKGRLEGEAEVLRRQLQLKFGELDAETVARIETADSEQLLQWAERVLSAETLDDLFAEPSSGR